MLNHLSTRRGRASPGQPDYLAPSLTIGAAGTKARSRASFDALCPAMTRFYVSIRNDPKRL
jgi:hypothetical protein